MRSLGLFCLAALALVVCGEYEFGSTRNACVDMVPEVNHPSGARILPQTGAAPFRITVSRSSYSTGSATLRVTIEATTTRPITAFLIQARRVNPSRNMNEPIGTFVHVPGSTKIMCTTSSGNAISQVSNMEQQTVEVTWSSRSPQGHLQFSATIGTPNGVYWVGERSPIVTDTTIDPLPTTTRAPVAPVQSSLKFDTDKCGDENGCYRYPSGCKDSACDMIVMWENRNDVINFKLGGNSEGWVAVGFSHDRKMGDDTVVECVWNEDENSVEVRQSYNDGKTNFPSSLNLNIRKRAESRSNGRVECSFTFSKKPLLGQGDEQLDGAYHILLAKGDIDPKNGRKLRHSLEPGKYPYVSPHRVDLTNDVDMGSTARYALVKVHGIFMLIAWMMCAFPAVLLAKYYKPMWPNEKVCGEKVWFAFHRGLNLVNLFCTILAFILVFVHVGGYSTLPDLPGKAHPILGIIVTVLCVLNPLIALCRPDPKSKCRPVFNWFHWFFGLVAIALATPTLFIGLNLHKAFVPWWATWVMVAFMLFHLVVELLLEIHGCLNARKQRMRDDEFEIRKRTDARGDYHGLLPEPVGTRFKKNVLTVYAVVVIVLGIIMIIAVAAG